MDLKTLKNKILHLLELSTIPDHDKMMVKVMMPVMESKVLNSLYDSLSDEKKKMNDLDKKQERVEFKYKVMMEKLAKMEEDK